MFEIRGNCVICTQRFVINNISALPCGHIFHYDCILEWFRCSRRCPNCRAFCSSTEIVRHLFFDDPDEHNDSSLLASPSQRLRLAEEAVRDLKNSLHRKNEEFENLKSTYIRTRAREYLKNVELSEENALLNAKNKEMEKALEKLSKENASLNAKNKEMEKALETTKRRLQACELWVLHVCKRTCKQLLEAKSLQSKLGQDLEESRENTDSRDVLPKRKKRRPLVDRMNGSKMMRILLRHKKKSNEVYSIL